ncbi:Methionine aminopeptidase [Trichinella pseudospiralis]
MGRTFWRSALTQSDSAALLTAIKEVWHLVCFCIREAASLGQCWFCYISYNEFQGRDAQWAGEVHTEIGASFLSS